MKESSTATKQFGLFKTILCSTLIVALFFAAAEIALRTWVYLFRSPAERFDLATGTFVLRPGNHPRFGAEPLHVNSRGFVGADFEDPPPPGVTRIVALGDSCTFGQGTFDGTYPAQLQIRLNSMGGRPGYQVINAGIEGLDSALAFRRLQSKVIPLGPDIVTIYIGWNDLMKVNPIGQTEHPKLAILARTMDRLWLTKGLRKLLFYYVRPRLRDPATGPTSRTGAFREYRPAVFEGNLRAIIASSRMAGARVVVMTLPSIVSDDMALEDIRRANVVFPYFSSAYAVGDYVDLIEAYNRSIRRVASKEEVVLVDLATEINGRPDRRQLFFDTMHPNQRGRELIAHILATRLRESGLLALNGRPASRSGKKSSGEVVRTDFTRTPIER